MNGQPRALASAFNAVADEVRVHVVACLHAGITGEERLADGEL